MAILNLTQHVATAEHIEAGVVEPSSEVREVIRALLTLPEMATLEELQERAGGLAAIALHHFTLTEDRAFMLGGPEPLVRLTRRAIKAHIAEAQCLESWVRPDPQAA